MARRKGRWRGPEIPGEFPTLGYAVAEFIQDRCVIPDGDLAGEPYLLTDEMLRFVLWHYRLDPATGKFAANRGSQLVRPQKWGKGPLSAALICAEGHPEGPVRFDGWDANGEPVGRSWKTPWIQVTALSEDQTDNVWRALKPMIELGPLADEILDTGETRINLPGGGFVEPTTSRAGSRLGQRITFAVQDQAELWTEHNGGRKLADTQRRNLAGTGGRFLETPNAWDPVDKSVAQQTSEDEEPGVYLDDVDPGKGSVNNKADRRRMLRRVYGDSYWVDLDRIDDEIATLIKRDPPQAERYLLNRKRAGADVAFDTDRWASLAREDDLPPGRPIVIGVDGARFVDALAIVGTDIETGFQWPVGIWERPEGADDSYEHPAPVIDEAMKAAFELDRVLRVYVDPQWIEHLLQKWQGRWGKEVVTPWYTNRDRQMAWAVRNHADAVASGDLTHDGSKLLAKHIRNARRRKVNVFDDKHRQMHTLAKESPDSRRKMDGAMASVLSWEARGDAIAAGEADGGAQGDWSSLSPDDFEITSLG